MWVFVIIDAKKVSESTDDSKKKNLIIQKSQTSNAGSKEVRIFLLNIFDC